MRKLQNENSMKLLPGKISADWPLGRPGKTGGNAYQLFHHRRKEKPYTPIVNISAMRDIAPDDPRATTDDTCGLARLWRKRQDHDAQMLQVGAAPSVVTHSSHTTGVSTKPILQIKNNTYPTAWDRISGNNNISSLY